MAELDIGAHCSSPTCKQLDFLPIVCAWCKKTYCKEHSPPDSHSCTEYASAASTSQYEGPRAFQCSFSDCGQGELTPVTCQACGNNYCLSHRHQADHNCEKMAEPEERMTKTQQHVQQILDAKKSQPFKMKKPKSKKAKAMAAKVGLMKLKQKAMGETGIPDTERLFFLVCFPLGSKDTNKAFFFSKKWSVGRAIDYVAASAGLINKNNVAGAKKLRLFDADTGEMYLSEKTLETLAEDGESLINGSTVIMEYVDNYITCLTEPEKYKT